jgi:biopolymer transport protein ExbB
MFEKLALVGVEWVVWLLVALSVVSIAMMVERAVFFIKLRKVDVPEMMERLRSLLVRNDVKGAERYLEKQPGVEAAVARAGLAEADRGPASAEEAMLGARVREKAPMERYLTYLGTLGNNAPFLGLFGTVTGIIKSFHALAVTANPNMKTVMFGIAEALVTTAVGLMVAIPAVVAHNVFQRQIKGIMSRSESLGRVVMAHLKSTDAGRERGESKGEGEVEEGGGEDEGASASKTGAAERG